MHYKLHLVSRLSGTEQKNRFNAIETWCKKEGHPAGLNNIKVIPSQKRKKKKLTFQSHNKNFECFVIKQENSRVTINVTQDPRGIKSILADIFCKIFEATITEKKEKHVDQKETILEERPA